MASAADLKFIVVPSSSVSTQTFWKTLHQTIITSFRNKQLEGVVTFPASWTRLPIDPAEGAQRLQEELGPDGILTIVLLHDQPIACAGANRYRGLNWMNSFKKAQSKEAAEDSGAEAAAVIATDDKGATVVSNDPAGTYAPTTGDYEVCCFCIQPEHRGAGLAPKLLDFLADCIKPLGAKRLFANHVIEETGKFWPRVGFQPVPGSDGVLEKDVTLAPGREPLARDLHFIMGMKEL